MKILKRVWIFLWEKLNLIFKSFFILLIYIYRLAISPLFMPSCRFHPTCSHYALEAFTNRNVISAIYLVSKRILSCHPFGGQGYDPVPDNEVMCESR